MAISASYLEGALVSSCRLVIIDDLNNEEFDVLVDGRVSFKISRFASTAQTASSEIRSAFRIYLARDLRTD
jgi:hypothetical protein